MNYEDMEIDEYYKDLPRKNNEFYDACSFAIKVFVIGLAIYGLMYLGKILL